MIAPAATEAIPRRNESLFTNVPANLSFQTRTDRR